MIQDRHSLLSPLARSAVIRTVINRRFHASSRRRIRELGRLDLAQVQAELLLGMVRKAAPTSFGSDHQFARIRSLAEFREHVPLRTYEDYWRDYWAKAAPKASGSTWPGPARFWALDGTGGSGEAKKIPVSSEMLDSYRKAVKTVIASHWRSRPRSRLFQGRLLVLPGDIKTSESVAPEIKEVPTNSLVRLTAGPWIRPLLLPPTVSSVEEESRNDRLVESSLSEPVSLVAGTPERIVSFFEQVLARSGKSTIAEVWPSLELVVRLFSQPAPSLRALMLLIGSRSIPILDSYSCAEGLIGYTTPGTDLFRFHFDQGIFYEFIPVQELNSPNPIRHWLGNIKSDTEYAVAISTCSGLWGYLLDQTIRFPSITPPLFSLTGRRQSRQAPTSSVLENGEIASAIAEASKATSSVASDWHAAFASGTDSSHSEFVLEFLIPPRDLALFRRVFDDELARQSATYRNLREQSDLTSTLRIAVATAGGLDSWSQAQGTPEGPQTVLTGEHFSALIDFLRSRGQLLTTIGQDAATRR